MGKPSEPLAEETAKRNELLSAVAERARRYGLGDKFAGRLRALRELAGLSQAELAARVGISQPSLATIESGQTRQTKYLVKIAHALGVDPAWLETGRKTDVGVATTGRSIYEIAGNEYTAIERYDAGVSAGAGSLIDPHAEALGNYLAETQWLRGQTGSAPHQLCVVRCSGDSMESTLFDGDWILLDRAQTRFSREGIYTLQFEDFVWIKRLSINLKSRNIIIISDNPFYKEQELPPDDVRIIGRAIAVVARKL